MEDLVYSIIRKFSLIKPNICTMVSGKNIVRILINTAIGAILIFFWLTLVDLDEIFHELQNFNLIYILPFIFFFALAGFLRALRLKFLLREYNLPLKNVTFLTYLGQLLSFTIPLRIGELAKGIYLSSEYNLPAAKSVVWIFMDRFIDFWMLLFCALLLLIFLPTNLPPNLVTTLSLVLGIFSLVGAMIIFTPNFSRKLAKLVSSLLIIPILRRVFEKVSNFLLDSASFLNQGFKGTGIILSVTLLSLIADAITWYVLVLAVFPITPDFLLVFLGSLLSMLTYILPAAPGYVGSAEAAGLAVFNLGLGLDRTLVSVVTLVFHALTLICILSFGVIALYLLKFDLRLVLKKLRRN
jgi:uncharacterized protein (TIRG00374 family)